MAAAVCAASAALADAGIELSDMLPACSVVSAHSRCYQMVGNVCPTHARLSMVVNLMRSKRTHQLCLRAESLCWFRFASGLLQALDLAELAVCKTSSVAHASCASIASC
jgi:ribonuclease PH